MYMHVLANVILVHLLSIIQYENLFLDIVLSKDVELSSKSRNQNKNSIVKTPRNWNRNLNWDWESHVLKVVELETEWIKAQINL